MTTPWRWGETLASGQVFEFRLWATLVEQSRGQLHVFLPPADRGIDALVHRLVDGRYCRVQAKGRTSLDGGEVHLVVTGASLTDDAALLIGGLVVEGGLGPTMLAVPVRDFKRLADTSSWHGEVVYEMGFGMRPRRNSRWLPYLSPLEKIVERFGVAPRVEGKVEEVVGEPPASARSDLGFHGESEVVLLLSGCADLNLFRPFPDLETSELAILHRQNRRVVGLQIKTMSVDRTHPSGTVGVWASSFRPSPTTYITVVAWLGDDGRFFEEYLLIPSMDLRSIAHPHESSGHFIFTWRPGSRSQSRLDVYRRELSRLGSDVQTILEA
jgi:hypothetical protein